MTTIYYLAGYDDYNPVQTVITTDDPDYAYVCIHVLGWRDITPQEYSVLSALKKAQLREWAQDPEEYKPSHDSAIRDAAMSSFWYGIKS